MIASYEHGVWLVDLAPLGDWCPAQLQRCSVWELALRIRFPA
jgi:hypothetical protein